MAMILDAFMSRFSELVVQMVENEVGRLLGIPGEFEKLCETIHRIQYFVADAERKQSISSGVKFWLMNLKDVMYDADDVIDLCQIKANERLAASSSHSTLNARYGCHLLSCFRNPLFAHEIGFKIKNINWRLKELAERIYLIGLTELPLSHELSVGVNRVDSIRTHKTDPLVVLNDIVGEKIEEDTELVVNWLTEEEKGLREIVHVYAIVGMGGIGKTTLAKKVYNDWRIREGFDQLIWVCVSKEIKAEDLLKYVIRGVGGYCGVAEEIWELIPMLEGYIRGKKFFLVLDDVWSESGKVWFGLLRDPMSSGAFGSKVLITTRNNNVAMLMRAIHIHRVSKLSLEDGWSLLVKQVVRHDPKESEIQELKDIGLQLIKKCDGVPLAIKSIGGVLCRKLKTEVEWQVVLESYTWSINGILAIESIGHAFHLSYEDLPSPLKQCFIFCSLFPEGFLFDKTKLIYQWLAEGFLQDKVNFWELGNEYYTELLVRNILEATNKTYNQDECKMHDLWRSFACHLGKDENCVLWNGEVLPSSLKIRRLSIEGNEVSTELFKKKNGLRTLFLRDKSEIALDYLCKAFSNLRTLDLTCFNAPSLPDSLCDLIHLRYLDVCGSKIKNLPDSIGNLKCLVYLNLTGCERLSYVPRSIVNLQELELLSIGNSGVRGIPTGLNKLDKLVKLLGFKPDKNSLEGFCSLDSIGTLSQLIDLHLSSLEKVSDMNIAKEANLQNKGRLQKLGLFYSSLSPEEQLDQSYEKKKTTEFVLNELCPPDSLESLHIVGYFGSDLPNWLTLRANLPNLRYIHIQNCACFEEIALLGQLPNLDYLQITEAYSVLSVGEHFLWGGIQNRDMTAMSCPVDKSAFPKLSELIFQSMPNWKEWQWNKGQVAMPNLKNLFIGDCPQLRSLPEGLLYHATSLEYLEIVGANKLITVGNLPSINEIRVFRNPKLEIISHLPSTSHIVIENCPNLKATENLKALQMMKLVDFEMKILPDYLRTTRPQKLIISCSEELLVKISSQGESGSEWNKFKHIPKVTIYSSGESFYATYQKAPFSFATNVSTRSIDSVQRSEMMPQQE